MPCTTLLKDIHFKPKGRTFKHLICALANTKRTGIILSGSPYSVYDADAPHVDPTVFDLGVPILGICYGLQVSSRGVHIPLEPN